MVCLKGQAEEPGDREPVLPEGTPDSLDEVFKAVVEGNHFASRISTLQALRRNDKALVSVVRLNDGYLTRVRNRPMKAEDGSYVEPAPIKRPPPPLFEIFCVVWHWIGELGFKERENEYYWACTLADFIRAENISDERKQHLMARCGIPLEADALLDGLAEAMDRRTPGNPKDELEADCYRALLDYILDADFRLLPQPPPIHR